MEVLYEVLKWVVIILTVFSAPLLIWTLITACVGFKKPKELEVREGKRHRFAVMVCARNEEPVIGNLLHSLAKQDYSADDYDVFVVADNCTDGTAQVSREHGAFVYERFNDKEKGKGYALHYGMDRLMKEHASQYDAVCVFDADNLVKSDFLTEMNRALCSGAEVALGYRDSKNIHDSWVSEVYSVYWLMLQRFYHTPRHTMGISSMVGGTGFAFKLSALGEEGWTTYSLTEDVEFSLQQVLKGHKIVPARRAVFYDEQPADYKVSVKQRLRWMVGGMQCIPLYFKSIVKAVFSGDKKALDLGWYLLFIPATGLTLPLNIASVGLMLLTPGLQPLALPVAIGGMALSAAFAMFMAYATLKLEGREIRPMLRAIILYPVFMLTMMCIAFVALVRPRTEWVPIAHSSSRTIDDINKAETAS